ncbi:MAG: hypothetical protein PHX86_05205 [Caldisericia bacterium]|nr:hypothetical protein [Caldisericia bacterium]
MCDKNVELKEILKKFSDSGWDLIDAPSKAWLDATELREAQQIAQRRLIPALQKADKECGSCGCEYDPLYKRALELLRNH